MAAMPRREILIARPPMRTNDAAGRATGGLPPPDAELWVPGMAVGGAPVSITNEALAGVGSGPKTSLARTWKVCEPSLSGVASSGEEHSVKADPSMLHSKAGGAGGGPSLEENVNVGVLSLLLAGGAESIEVSGERSVLSHAVSTVSPGSAIAVSLLPPRQLTRLGFPLRTLSVSLSEVPLRFSTFRSVSVPPPPVFWGAVVARLTVTAGTPK